MTAGARIQLVEKFGESDIAELCEAASLAILDGGGFGWLEPPPRQTLEAYWRGVMLVPERELYIARLNGVICGSAQLVAPPKNNEAQKHVASIQHAFIAPWARGHGLARDLVRDVELRTRKRRFRVLNLDIRKSQENAIKLYTELGFEHWATHPYYAFVRGQWTEGLFFYKNLLETDAPPAEPVPE
ncbi:MAG: N-acetyltransferase family protein [Alphaproteobacteria bacterium]